MRFLHALGSFIGGIAIVITGFFGGHKIVPTPPSPIVVQVPATSTVSISNFSTSEKPTQKSISPQKPLEVKSISSSLVVEPAAVPTVVLPPIIKDTVLLPTPIPVISWTDLEAKYFPEATQKGWTSIAITNSTGEKHYYRLEDNAWVRKNTLGEVREPYQAYVPPTIPQVQVTPPSIVPPVQPTPSTLSIATQQVQTCQKQYDQSLLSLGDGGVKNATSYYNHVVEQTYQIINNCGAYGTCFSGQRGLAQEQVDQAKTQLDNAMTQYQISLEVFKKSLQSCLGSIVQSP